MTDGIVNIHGKEYRTVAYRINAFREKYGLEYGIYTEVLESTDERVCVRATIIKDGVAVSTGIAEEIRGSSNINSTSALENCETSAVGRCLAFLGGEFAGSEIASADEVANAITQQKEMEQVERLKRHNAAVRDNLESIVAMKHAFSSAASNEQMGYTEDTAQDYSAAYEAYQEIPQKDWEDLRVATTKGGIFTTREAQQIKSNEFGAARKAYHGLEE